jgi:hypothetical protein
MTLERMVLIATSQFHLHIRTVEVSQEHIFSFQSNEEGRAVTSGDRLYSCWFSMENFVFDPICVVPLF